MSNCKLNVDALWAKNGDETMYSIVIKVLRTISTGSNRSIRNISSGFNKSIRTISSDFNKSVRTISTS
jgi:hypothetical protein